MSPAAFVRFAALVGVVFLWALGDRLWHAAATPNLAGTSGLFLGVLALGSLGPMTRRIGPSDAAHRHRNTGVLVVGAVLLAVVGVAAFVVGLAVEFLARASGSALAATVSACWHALTVVAVGLLAVGERPTK